MRVTSDCAPVPGSAEQFTLLPDRNLSGRIMLSLHCHWAVTTPGFRLPLRHLAQAVMNVLLEADPQRVEWVAMPAISTGVAFFFSELAS
jgi:hypothetical protein